MAMTNFGRLLTDQLTVWSRDIWKATRNKSFLNNFTGSNADSMVQRITELKKSSKGARAVITLVPDLEGDGVVGDNQLEGNEEEIKAYGQAVKIDQLRNANRSEGRMAEQKTVIDFRSTSRDLLSQWLADRIDQIAILTMSGVALTFKTDGTARTGSQLGLLEFASSITAPSANRHRRWVAASNTLAAGATNAVVATDYPSWKMLVASKAYAVNNFIRPIRTADGIEVFNVFMTPDGIARLKQDPDFIAHWQHAQKRGDENPLFKGTPHGGTNGFYIDGMNILEFRHVYHSSTWGAGANVKGQRVLFAGAQALAMADIGMPTWDEEMFDYGNSPGISISKMFGFLKPVWRSQVTGTDEDFGTLVVDTAV